MASMVMECQYSIMVKASRETRVLMPVSESQDKNTSQISTFKNYFSLMKL